MWHLIENHIRILHRLYTCLMRCIMIIQRIAKVVISPTCLWGIRSGVQNLTIGDRYYIYPIDTIMFLILVLVKPVSMSAFGVGSSVNTVLVKYLIR